MDSQKNPVYRKIIVPWYDSEVVCLVIIVLMFLAFLFGVAGISVVWESSDNLRHLWLVLSVILLSTGVIVSTTTRLIKRYLGRLKQLAVGNGKAAAGGTGLLP